jgi:SAM-dependent methyltransferase
MLDAGAVGKGTYVLDAGCGAGGASLLAAGRGAFVNGLDAAAALVAIAQHRVPDGYFQVGDLEVLPYADTSFDVVIAADVLPYTAQPAVAMRELARVCRPEGRVVVAVWGSSEQCAQRAILWATRDLLPVCLGEEPFALSEVGTVEDLAIGAGLHVLGAGEVTCSCAYPDRATAWRALASAGYLQAALRLSGVRLVRTVVLRALAPYTTPEGAIGLVHRFRYVTAQASSGLPSPRPAAGPPREKGDETM